MRSPTRPAADEIGMRCKPLFYFSRGSLAFGRWQCHTLSSRAKNHGSLAMLIQSSVVGLWSLAIPRPCHPEQRIIVRLRTTIRSRGTLRFRLGWRFAWCQPTTNDW